MQRTLKALKPLGLFVRFLTFAGLGVLTLTSPIFVNRFLYVLCVLALLLNGVPALLTSVLQRREPHPHALQTGVVSIVAAGVLLAFPALLGKSLVAAVGVWALLVGAIQLGYLAQLFITRERGTLRYLLLAFASFAVAAALLLSPRGGALLHVLAGGYLVLYGLWQLIDMFGVLVNRNVESSAFLSRFRVKPPVLLTALLPSAWLRGLEKRRDTRDIVIEKPSRPLREPEELLDVYFHLGRNVAFGFGHVDVSVRGHTISYGCYDESSNRLFGLLSDGVFLLCPTAPYLEYCRNEEKKFMVGFSLAITHADGERVLAAIERIVGRCEPWKPAEKPERRFDARYYKVKTGSFRVYNALKTNCAAMAELIASESGLNLLPPNGFVTQGAYFGFLENELRDPKSNVVRQVIYSAAQSAGKNPSLRSE